MTKEAKEEQLGTVDAISFEIATLRQLISHQRKVREDRRWQFEQWDENSRNLIAQYEKRVYELGLKK